ncbi:hypothetical protein ACJ73_07102 [Blastomyces percursus]|uniref:Uncharacterized protein n=1 Tax=Blastomyces percursus TaxID=1658174 RepID=A0A1J9QMX6_9EURO|nr:hypothetical protein ACJ73_07102 [Blastomyces percursus]
MPTPPESRDRGCSASRLAKAYYTSRIVQSFKPTAVRTRTPTSLGSLRTAVYYFYQGNQALLQPIIRAGEVLALEVETYRIENQALAQHLHKQRTRQRQKAAVANDLAASIIYIAKHAAAENLSTEQIAPIYDLIDRVNVVGGRHTKRLERELEEQDKQIEEMEKMLGEQDRQIEEIAGRYHEEIRRVVKGADLAVRALSARVERLEQQLKALRVDGLG